ncbi:MAG TPA: hypothetical protein PLL39_08100, partial [Rhodocyclaceae bacterium]|nr:hypothetical protein [Rhodocyclaceae bacterium]
HGRDIYAVVERYLDLDPKLVFLIIDEDFLLNKRRAMEFRECVMKGGRTVSIFAFSSIKAISQYTVVEILEMGIDGDADAFELAEALELGDEVTQVGVTHGNRFGSRNVGMKEG